VQRRGDRGVSQGSETNAVLRMIRLYGAVPIEAYPGLIGGERHDHTRMSKEIQSYLDYAEENDIWDEEYVLEHVRAILNRYLGEPPTVFDYDGRMMTPHAFVKDVLKLNVDDYPSAMSTLYIPFYTRGVFDVYDNWWRDSTYYNLPLDEWYTTIVRAIDNGYTLTIGGDVSEPGWNGFEDAAVVPDFDIPQSFINQDSREYRFYHDVTTDDHGVHLVGHLVIDGRDWFLVKDSSRSARWGKFRGYYFVRDDYVRLKMLTITVHKDVLGDILLKFESTPDEG
jgi:bleomycin hydrolase